MKKEKIKVKEIEIPNGVNIEINKDEIKVNGPKGEIKKRFGIKLEKKENKLIFEVKGNKRDKKRKGTIIAHIKNMICGVVNGFEYKLQICPVHFPIKVSISPDKKNIIIENFLGETKKRKADILSNVNIEIKGDIITVNSIDKEAAGQTAANIEMATKIRNKDRRIFQDGIFMIEKAGKKI